MPIAGVVETSFRDASQLLGLHDCQCRSFRAQENHVALVFVAFQFLARQAHQGETIGEVLRRLKAHAVVITHVPLVPNIRPVAKERRRSRRDGGDGRASGNAA